MTNYRELAMEAVITLSVVADSLAEDFDRRIAARANTLAMKLGILDIENDKAADEIAGQLGIERRPPRETEAAEPEPVHAGREDANAGEPAPKAAPQKKQGMTAA